MAVIDRRTFVAAPTGAIRLEPRLDWRFILLGAILGFAVLEALFFTFREGGLWQFGLGFDQHTYMTAARDWLAGRGFYEPYQLAGPYVIQAREILYPPSLLVLLVPFSFLPEFLWVLVPLAITAGITWACRPSYLGWVLIAVCLAAPSSFGLYLFGNPGYVGRRRDRPGDAVRRRATGPDQAVFFVFALFGIRRRAWWLTLALCIAFAPADSADVARLPGRDAQHPESGSSLRGLDGPDDARSARSPGGRARSARSSARPYRCEG